MRMKKIGSIALGLAFLGLASCATDTPDAPAPQGPSVKDTYATITISLPSGGTRAEGDEEDVDSKGIYTGDGRRDWVFYTKNLKIFSLVFNKALESLPVMPLLIEAEEDAGWEEYLHLRSETYVPDED